jgi:hypothetical protein
MDAFRTLMEIQHLRGILLESRLDFLRNKYIPLLVVKIEKLMNSNDQFDDEDFGDLLGVLGVQGRYSVDPALSDEDIARTNEDIARKTFDWIVSLDPNIHKKNAQWLLDGFTRDRWIPEDGYKAIDLLGIYDRVKHLMPVEQRDIRYFRDFPSLYTAIRPYEARQSNRAVDRQLDAEMHKQAEVVYDGPDYKIVIPKTKEASCYFGMNTQWCTAAKNSYNAFADYNTSGPLYIILDKKNNERWQFHFGSAPQFMDETDAPIDKEQFVADHPKLMEIFLPIVLKRKQAVLMPVTFETVISTTKLVARRRYLQITANKEYRVFDDALHFDEPYMRVFVDESDRLTMIHPYDILGAQPKQIAVFLNKLGIQGFSLQNPNFSKEQVILNWTGEKFVANPHYKHQSPSHPF